MKFDHVTAHTRIGSPLGDILLARSPHGLTGLWFEGQKDHPGTLAVPDTPRDPLLAHTAEQLDEYWAGRRTVFELPLDLRGTPFQLQVWHVLLEIRLGATTSYAAVARQIGSPRATRAVGAAVGLNPVSIIVPCHRIVGSKGALTGYAGGLNRKIHLLQLEGVDARG